jgi:hypothetical protein
VPIDYTLWNLKEAAEQLARIVASLESGDTEEFNPANVDLLYHHLNTAWNARDATAKQVEECSEADFFAWRRFPEDLPLNFVGPGDE